MPSKFTGLMASLMNSLWNVIYEMPRHLLFMKEREKFIPSCRGSMRSAIARTNHFEKCFQHGRLKKVSLKGRYIIKGISHAVGKLHTWLVLFNVYLTLMKLYQWVWLAGFCIDVFPHHL